MKPKNTEKQYLHECGQAQEVFKNKNKDYGTSWTSMRPSSHTDQIYIKALRIRSIEEKKEQKVADSIPGEYIGIYNYAIMAIMRLRLKEKIETTLKEDMEKAYLSICTEIFELMKKKNHDYGGAWRIIRISSLTDLIIQKIIRVKEIEDNNGVVAVSEGLEANYMDMANYAIFAMIRLSEK